MYVYIYICIEYTYIYVYTIIYIRTDISCDDTENSNIDCIKYTMDVLGPYPTPKKGTLIFDLLQAPPKNKPNYVLQPLQNTTEIPRYSMVLEYLPT